VLWVDALCINQEDDKERGHQVFQMGTIYSHASQVCVWVGLADSFAEGAFRLLSRKETMGGIKRGIIKHPEDWYDMAEFCKREYWDRLWIIQEVVLARKIEVYCGHLHFPWKALSDVLCSFNETVGILMDDQDGRVMPCGVMEFCHSIMSSTTAALCRERRQRKQTTALDDLSLLALLRRYRKAKCSDIRDKIFGLHSFTPACCAVANPVDFMCSAWDLCNRLLDHHYRHHETFLEPASMLDDSKDLHCLLMGGAIHQKGTSYEFPLHSEGIKNATGSSSSDLTGYRYTEIISVSHTTRTLSHHDGTIKETKSSPWNMTTELEISLHLEPNFIETSSSKGQLHSSSTLEDLSTLIQKTQGEDLQKPTTEREGLVQISYHELIESVHRLVTATELEWNPYLQDEVEQQRSYFRYRVGRLRWPVMHRDERKGVLARVVDCIFAEMRRRGFQDDKTKWSLEQALNLATGVQEE
jgi:hypothetical protein